MKVSATVPMRIDLAGGTLDVYPLYLFENGGLTVNAAISIRGRVTVEERADACIHIRSEDTGAEEAFASQPVGIAAGNGQISLPGLRGVFVAFE